MRVERAVTAVQSEGTRAYLTTSLAPFSNPDTESCRHDTSPAASGRRWPEARSDPMGDREAMGHGGVHFRASCLYSYLETQGLGRMAKWATELRTLSFRLAEEIRGEGRDTYISRSNSVEELEADVLERFLDDREPFVQICQGQFATLDLKLLSSIGARSSVRPLLLKLASRAQTPNAGPSRSSRSFSP
jgi:hypothetical protein